MKLHTIEHFVDQVARYKFFGYTENGIQELIDTINELKETDTASKDRIKALREKYKDIIYTAREQYINYLEEKYSQLSVDHCKLEGQIKMLESSVEHHKEEGRFKNSKIYQYQKELDELKSAKK